MFFTAGFTVRYLHFSTFSTFQPQFGNQFVPSIRFQNKCASFYLPFLYISKQMCFKGTYVVMINDSVVRPTFWTVLTGGIEMSALDSVDILADWPRTMKCWFLYQNKIQRKNWKYFSVTKLQPTKYFEFFLDSSYHKKQAWL